MAQQCLSCRGMVFVQREGQGSKVDVTSRGMVLLLEGQPPLHQAVQHCCYPKTRAVAIVAGRVPCAEEGTRTQVGPGSGPAAGMAGGASQAEMTETGAISHRAAETAGGAPRAEGSELMSISLPIWASGTAHLPQQCCLMPLVVSWSGAWSLIPAKLASLNAPEVPVSSIAYRLICTSANARHASSRADQQLQQ